MHKLLIVNYVRFRHHLTHTLIDGNLQEDHIGHRRRANTGLCYLDSISAHTNRGDWGESHDWAVHTRRTIIRAHVSPWNLFLPIHHVEALARRNDIRPVEWGWIFSCRGQSWYLPGHTIRLRVLGVCFVFTEDRCGEAWWDNGSVHRHRYRNKINYENRSSRSFKKSDGWPLQ